MQRFHRKGKLSSFLECSAYQTLKKFTGREIDNNHPEH